MNKWMNEYSPSLCALTGQADTWGTKRVSLRSFPPSWALLRILYWTLKMSLAGGIFASEKFCQFPWKQMCQRPTFSFVTGFSVWTLKNIISAMGMPFQHPVMGPLLRPDLLKEDTRHSVRLVKTTRRQSTVTLCPDSVLQLDFSRSSKMIQFSNTRHSDVPSS